MLSYSSFQEADASVKEALVILEASRRLVGWELVAGSVYRIPFTYVLSDINPITEAGTALTSVASLLTVVPGTYYIDYVNKILYLNTTGSVNPNGVFIASTFKLFFSRAGVNLPHDLDTGFEVHWDRMIETVSQFSTELDNQYQLGEAIEGSGTLSLINDRDYWDSKFDKLYFENKNVWIYSWSPGLPVSEAKILFKGKVVGKSWDQEKIQFQLKDSVLALRAPVELENIGDIVGARVPDNLKQAKKRRLYGYVYGHRPTNIDHVLDGYPLTGTFSVSNGSTAVTGTGTLGLKELNPDDELLFGDTTGSRFAVKEVTSNTAIVLTKSYVGPDISGVTAYVRPKRPKRYANREFVIAGHALKEPSTVIQAILTPNVFRLASVDSLMPGDTIKVGSEATEILLISTYNIVKISSNLASVPFVGETVTRPALSNVHLDDRELTETRDFTYSAVNGTLTLDELAEFNVAPDYIIPGTVAFTSSSRSVTGTGTQFKSVLEPGDWIKSNGESDYFEVLSIESDTALTLKSASTYTVSGQSPVIRQPNVYEENKVILTVDAMGVTSDGTTTGQFASIAPRIVKHALTEAGLGDSLELTSFTESEGVQYKPLGFAIPVQMHDTKPQALRDVINLVNMSTMSALIQNADHQFEFRLFSPERLTTDAQFLEHDILQFSIESVSDKIVKTVKIRYQDREFDYLSKAKSFQEEVSTSDTAQYLALNSNEKIIETALVLQEDAEIMASRWSFILEVASSAITLATKMQGARLSVTDRMRITHRKLYERVGSTGRSRFAGIQAIRKGFDGVAIQLEDLSNAFSRCGTITDDDALDYAFAIDDDRVYNGYITDDYGMQDNDPDTFGQSEIW